MVYLCFWATVSALVCLVCSSTVVRNYDDDDDDDDGRHLMTCYGFRYVAPFRNQETQTRPGFDVDAKFQTF